MSESRSRLGLRPTYSAGAYDDLSVPLVGWEGKPLPRPHPSRRPRRLQCASPKQISVSDTAAYCPSLSDKLAPISYISC